MIVGGYTLDLYCSNPNCTRPHHGSGSVRAQYCGISESECRIRAKFEGWRFIVVDGRKDVLCPQCAKNGGTK